MGRDAAGDTVFAPVVALHSRLRHKEGASTGLSGGVRHKSLLSERYGVI